MMGVNSNVLGPEILKLLGIPANKVKGFNICFSAGEPVNIRVEYVGIVNADPNDIEGVFKSYKLVEIE